MTTIGRILSAIILISVGMITFAMAQPNQPVGIVTIICPPEPVKREGKFMVAKEITATIKIEFGNCTYNGTVVFPDATVRRTGVGTMLVDSVTAKGVVK